MAKINVTINGNAYAVEEGKTILQAARENGVYIPTLCNFEGIEARANCRICVVEVEGMRTFQPACATKVSNNMVVNTDTEKVRAARKATLELIMAHHAVDCHHCMTTDHSVKDAEDLAVNLGIKYDIVPIKDCFDALRNTMKPVFGDRAEDVTEENMQARIRGTILMSYSNKFGALVLNTTNKSEAAMGYGTLYGDSCGALSVIGDLYKTEVYELSEWINREREIIPWNSIHKAPSAELRPGQKDSDSLPDYGVLDTILNLHIEEQMSLEEIVAEGYDEELVAQVIRKVRQNEWKRLQFAPQLKVSPMSFGLDRRVPIS